MLTPEDNPTGDVASLRLRRVLGDDPFRLIADNVGDVVSLFNVDTLRLEYISPSVERQRGFTQEEALGQSLEDIFTAESALRLQAAMADALAQATGGVAGTVRHTLELEQRRKDGTLLFVELTGTPVLDEDGAVRYVLAVTHDVTDRIADREALRVQRDLAVSLSAARDLSQALDLVLEAALSVPGVDCGGVYLVQPGSGDLELTRQRNLPRAFLATASYYAADSDNARLVARGDPLHLTAAQVAATTLAEHAAGLRAISSVPVRHEGTVVAALNVASLTSDELTTTARTAVESLAAQIAGALTRLRAEAQLQENAHRHESLFVDSPVALWETDFSLVKAYLDTLAASGIEDVIAHVLADPAEYRRCVGLIRPLAANSAAVRLCRATDEPELLARNSETRPPAPGPGGVHLYWAEMLAGGSGGVTYETVTHTLSGDSVDVLETVTVVPGHEAFYDRVYVADIDITARKRADRALEESEARYRLLADNVTDVLWVLDLASFTYDFISPSVERVSGYTAEEALETPLSERLTQESRQLSRQAIQAGVARYLAGETDAVVSAEVDLIHKDGSTVPVEISATILPSPDGRPHKVLGVSRDITARRAAERALRESEARYRAVSDTAADAIVSADLDGAISGWNAAAQRMFGYTQDEAVGMPVTTLMPEAFRAGHPASMERLREGGESRLAGTVIELEGHRRDGSEFPIELSLALWEVAGERFVTTIIRDVSERRAAERAVAESEAQFRLVAENASDVVFRSDRDAVTQWVSPSITAVAGWRPEELVGRSIEGFVHPDDLETLLAGQRTVTEGEPAIYEFRLLTAAGGHRWVSASVKPIVDARGHMVGRAGGLRDIQAEVEGRDALAASEERYRRVFDVEPDGLLLVDRETLRIVEANEAAERIYGYAHAELLQQTVTRLSAEPEATRRAVEAAGRDGTHVPLRSHRRKDGTAFPVEIAAATLTLGNHDLVCLAVRDVGERERRTALTVATSEITAKLLQADEQATSTDLYNVILLPLLLATQADRVRVYEHDASAAAGGPFTQRAFLAAPGAPADPGAWETGRDFGRRWWQLVERGEPFLLPSRDRQDGVDRVLEGAGLRSLLALPFGARGEALGFVALEYARDARDWQREELLQLGVAASALSTALERQLALSAVRARTSELSALLGANRAIVSSLDYDRVMDEVTRTTGELLGSPRCMVWEVSADRRGVRVIGPWHGTGAGLPEAEWPGHASHEPLAAESLESGELAVRTLADRDLAPGVRRMMEERGETSVLAVPLLSRGRLIGVMTLHETAARTYTPQELSLAKALGEQAAVALANAQLYRDQERRNRWLHALVEAGRQVTSKLAVDDLLDNVARLAAEAVLAPVACIYEYVAVDDAFVARSRFGPEGAGRGEPPGTVFPVEQSPDDRRALFGGEVFVETLSDPALHLNVRADMERDGEKTLVNVPFRFAGEPLGMMVLVETEAEREYGADELDYLSAFGEQVAVALHNARLYATIESQAATDGSTGLANYRTFYRRLEQELARAVRYATPVSLLLLDVDDFKAINDTYGHLAGDEALRAIAGLIRAEIRAGVDLPARYGGEEFAVILPETPCEATRRTAREPLQPAAAITAAGRAGPAEPGAITCPASALAERIRARIADERITVGDAVDLQLSVSVGVAGAPLMAEDARDLIARADEALYAAKAAGKDCVRIYGK